MQKGFITIPILIIAILGTLVAGGGGYAFYKYNKVSKEKDDVESQLNEQKDKEIQRLQEQVNVLQEPIGTTTEETSETEESPVVAEKKVESVITAPSKAKVVPAVAPAVTPVVSEITNPVQTQDELLTDIAYAREKVAEIKKFVANNEESIDGSNYVIREVEKEMAKLPNLESVQTAGENLINNQKKLISLLEKKNESQTKLINLFQSAINGNDVWWSELLAIVKDDNTHEDIVLYDTLSKELIKTFGKTMGDAYDAQIDVMQEILGQ